MEEKGIFGGVRNYCQPSKAWFDELHLISNVQLFSLCPYRYPELIETKRGEKTGFESFTTPTGVEMYFPICLFDWKFKSSNISGNW